MMRKLLALIATITAVFAIGVTPAAAITDGVLDGQGHPFVGLMVAKNDEGSPMWRCSGTLLSSTVFVTAGHCTEGPAAEVEIWFDPHVDRDPSYVSVAAGGQGCADPAVNGYPCWGDVSGTPHTHPDYDPNQFFYRDLGVVVLDAPWTSTTYGVLPAQDQLDTLATRRGTQDVRFRAVGYGLQRINPVFIEEELDRMVAYPQLIQINGGLAGDYAVILSNNAWTGGTCYGDSGGPNFLGDSNVVAAVTSFGISPTCGGWGGAFRLDRSWSLDWINGFLD
jgi:hypothetical protein